MHFFWSKFSLQQIVAFTPTERERVCVIFGASERVELSSALCVTYSKEKLMEEITDEAHGSCMMGCEKVWVLVPLYMCVLECVTCKLDCAAQRVEGKAYRRIEMAS